MSDDLNAGLAELQARLEEAKSLLGPLNDQGLAIDTEINIARRAFEEQMELLRKKKAEYDNEVRKRRQYAYDLEAQLKEKQRIIEEENRKKELAAAYAAEQAARAEKNADLVKKFEQQTMGAYWREFAKDHQIEAGHFITENRKVILADVMGLGKTLSSIITAEMAFAMTKETSPEFPTLGFEKEVYTPPRLVWTDKAVEEHNRLIEETGKSPFLRYTHNGPVAGQNIGYVDFDPKQRWRNQGIIEQLPESTKIEIVNAIERPVGRKIIYLCPSSLIRNVRGEWKHWAKHRNVVFVGEGISKIQRNMLIDMVVSNFEEWVIVCNYEAWRRDQALIDRFISLKFDTLVIDEAHNAKNPETAIHKGITRLLQEANPEYVIPMTGTPILNRPEDLFYLLQMVNPEEYHHLNDFLYAHCEQKETENGTFIWVFKEGGLDRLIPKIRKNFMRRTKDQAGIILPPRSIIEHELTLDPEAYPEQARARDEMRKYMTVLCSKDKTKAIPANAVIAMYTRLRQIETWPAGIVVYDKYTDEKGNTQFIRDPHTGEKQILMQLDVEESQKVDYVIRFDKESNRWEGLIPEVIEDERVVLFSQFKAPLREIERRINAMGKSAVCYDGDTPKALANEIRKDFDKRETPDRSQARWDAVLCNYKVGGVGLNLTCATQLIVLDEEWNPGKRDQAYDRIHRMGQDNPVTIHVVRDKDTVDDWLANIMEAKEDIVNGFTGAVLNMGNFKDALESGLI